MSFVPLDDSLLIKKTWCLQQSHVIVAALCPLGFSALIVDFFRSCWLILTTPMPIFLYCATLLLPSRTSNMLITVLAGISLACHLRRLFVAVTTWWGICFFWLKACSCNCRHNYWDDCLTWSWLRRIFRRHPGLWWAGAFYFLDIHVLLASDLRLLLLHWYCFSGWLPILPFVSARVLSAASCCDTCSFLPADWRVLAGLFLLIFCRLIVLFE